MRMVYCKQTDGSHPCEGHSQGVINCLEKDTGRSCHNWTRILCEIELRIHPNQTLLLLLSSLTLCNPKDCSTPGFPVLHYFPGSVQTCRINDSIHLILCCPLLLLPSIFPNTRVFSKESASDRPIHTICEGTDSQDSQNELSHLF